VCHVTTRFVVEELTMKKAFWLVNSDATSASHAMCSRLRAHLGCLGTGGSHLWVLLFICGFRPLYVSPLHCLDCGSLDSARFPGRLCVVAVGELHLSSSQMIFECLRIPTIVWSDLHGGDRWLRCARCMSYSVSLFLMICGLCLLQHRVRPGALRFLLKLFVRLV